MRSDSSALLGTLVQGGAAIVAIIAGLLVARIANLSSEREVWDRRVRELTTTRRVKAEIAERARVAVLHDDAEAFIDSNWERYLKAYPDIDLDAFWREYGTPKWSIEEFRPYLDELDRKIGGVRERLAQLKLRERDSLAWRDENERTAIRDSFSDKLSRDIAEEMLDFIEDYWLAKRPKKAFAITGMSPRSVRKLASLGALRSPEIQAANMGIEAARYKDLQSAWSDAANELQVVDLELRYAVTAQTLAKRPSGVWRSIWTLQVITLFAVVLPLVQMATWGTTLSRGQRLFFAGLFIASLAIFFAYLANEIRRIARGSNEPDAAS